MTNQDVALVITLAGSDPEGDPFAFSIETPGQRDLGGDHENREQHGHRYLYPGPELRRHGQFHFPGE